MVNSNKPQSPLFMIFARGWAKIRIMAGIGALEGAIVGFSNLQSPLETVAQQASDNFVYLILVLPIVLIFLKTKWFRSDSETLSQALITSVVHGISDGLAGAGGYIAVIIMSVVMLGGGDGNLLTTAFRQQMAWGQWVVLIVGMIVIEAVIEVFQRSQSTDVNPGTN